MSLKFAISTLVLVSQIAFVFVAILFFMGKTRVKAFFHKHALSFSFLVAAAGMLGSLYFSKGLGWEPCELCWYQRIFLYPQVFLFAIGLWKKDRSVFTFAVPLSIFGAIVAVYHLIVQQFPSAAFCDAAASCSRVFTYDYGYITIPMMALTAFVLLLGLAYANKH